MGTIGFGLGSTASGGGTITFAPTDVSGLVLWLKADAITGLSDSDPVSTWTDSSGNSNSATGSGTARPLYKTGILNSLPVVRFDGVNDTLRITRNAGLEPSAVTIIAVFRGAAAPGSFSYMIAKPYTVDGTASWGIQKDQQRCLTRVAGSLIVTATYTTTIWDGTGRITDLLVNGDSLAFYFGGKVISVPAASGAIDYDANDVYLGSWDGTQLYWLGDLAEVLIYNTSLGLQNLGRVQNYLTTKYAL